MDTPLFKVLLVEEDEEDYLIVREILTDSKGHRFTLAWAPTYAAGLAQIEQEVLAAVLVDYSLGRRTGLEFIQKVAARGSPVPMIFLTGQGNYEVELQAMLAGAADYLNKKEIHAPLLERSIRYANEQKQTERQLRQIAVRAELLANLSCDFPEAGLDYLRMIHKITRRISETFGDAIILRILAEDGKTPEPAAIDHPDPQAREPMVDLLSNTTQHVGEAVVGEVTFSREPRLLCDTSLEELVETF